MSAAELDLEAGERVEEEIPEEPAALAGPPPIEEMEWAEEEDLGAAKGYEDVPLPLLGKKVRVRLLGGPEVAELEMLPDVAGYSRLASKEDRDRKKKDPDPSEIRHMAVDFVRYRARLVHRAVMSREARIGRTVKCDECTAEAGEDVRHVRSLWSIARAERLKALDAEVVLGVALQTRRVERLVPFSTDGTASDTSTPPDTGESIPEPSS